MITLEESNIYTYISCDTSSEDFEVRKGLTFIKKVKAYSRRPLTITTRLFREQGGYLIIFKGITLDLISHLQKEGLELTHKEYKIIFPKPEPEDYESAIENLRPYQVDALNAAIEHNGGILWLATNAGKTEVAGALINAYPGHKFLYLVTGNELQTQTLERFRNKFGMQAGELSTQRQELNSQVTVAMAQTLYSRIDKLSEFLSEIDCIIWDECQHAGGKTADTIFSRCTSATFRLGLTGTVPSDEAKRLTIQQFFGPVSYRVPNSYLIENEYSSGIHIFMVRGDWGHTEVGAEVQRLVMLEQRGLQLNLWHEACMMGIIKNEARNQAILLVLNTILAKYGTGVLIFVDYIEHGQILSELTGVPFVHADCEYRHDLFGRFKNGDIPCLISSPILDEGVDVSRIHHIIFASGRKSEIKLLQRIGRGLRKEEGKEFVDLYDFYDDEINMLEKHSKKRLEIYKQEGFSVTFKEIHSLLGLI